MIGKMLMIHKKNMNVILVVVACAAITAVGFRRGHGPGGQTV